jgi:hypothetical protein
MPATDLRLLGSPVRFWSRSPDLSGREAVRRLVAGASTLDRIVETLQPRIA